MKTLLLSLLFGLAISNCPGQQPSLPVLPKVITPAPNAANLGEYLSVPKNLFTGTVNVSIPLLTITDGSLKIPISLEYKTGGIKVSEIASSCGLGWNLIAGGQISRSVVGMADETPTFGYFYSPNYTSFSMVESEQRKWQIADGALDGQPDLFYFSTPMNSGRFVFTKGKKIITIPKTNYLFNFDSVQSFTSPNTGVAYLIPSWKITDDNGNIFKFNIVEKNVNSPTVLTDGNESGSSSISVNTWYLSEILSPFNNKISLEYLNAPIEYDLPFNITSNMLVQGGINNLQPEIKSKNRTQAEVKKISRIVFSAGELIFNYIKNRPDLIGDKCLESIVLKSRAGKIIRQFLFRYKILEGINLNNLEAYSMVNETNKYTSTLLGTPSAPMYRRLMLESVTEADSSGNKLNDGYRLEYHHDMGLPDRVSDRIDHWGYANGATEPPKIVARQSPSNVFGLDYFMYGREPNINNSKQGSLSKIIYPTSGYSLFEYEGNTAGTTPSLPPVIVRSNLAVSIPFVHSLYGSPIYEGDGGPAFTWKTNSLGQSVKHYYVEFTVAEAGMYQVILQSMPYYPNADLYAYLKNMSDSLYTYWSNNVNGTYNVNLQAGVHRLYHAPSLALVAATNNPDRTQLYSVGLSGANMYSYAPATPGVARQVGGIRLKKHTLFDPVSASSLIKSYTYDLEGSSSGALVNFPSYQYKLTINGPDIHSGVTGESEYRVFTSSSIYPLSTTAGSYVGYGFVSEEIVDVNGQSSGKTNNYYIDPAQEPDLIFTPGMDPGGTLSPPNEILPDPPVENNDWLRGVLIRQDIYDKNNNLLSRIDNRYERLADTSLSRGYTGAVFAENLNNSTRSYYFIPYHYSTGQFYVSQKDEYSYQGSAAINKRTLFRQSPASLLPIQSTTNNSNGDSTVIFYTYPREYLSGTAFIDSLVARNMVATPIEVVSTQKTSGSVTAITTGTATVYDPLKRVMSSLFYLENNGPVPLSQFRFSNATAGQLPTPANRTSFVKDPLYKNLHDFTLYDAYGNILEQKKTGDVTEVYLWGYNSQYPVAKIVGNKNYSQIISESGIDTSQLRSPATDAALRTYLGSLRNIAGVMASVYTYAPLVGLTSETNPAGRTTYYEYDSFGRLITIKDHDQHVVKVICYNYAGSIVGCSVPVVYKNAVRSQSFTRACSPGYIGSTVTYTVPADTYTSTISQADADQKAQNDINANGQNYANANGTCTATNVVVSLNRGSGVTLNPVTVEFLQNSTVVYTKTFATTGSTSLTIAAGTYNLRFTLPSAQAGKPFFHVYSTSAPYSIDSWYSLSNLTTYTTGAIMISGGTISIDITNSVD